MIKKSTSGDYHVMTSLCTFKDLEEALSWCRQHIQRCDFTSADPCDTRGYSFERFHNSTNFVFHREKDAFVFALRFQ